ncbi:response regulator [Planobispora longispora]|uniref:Response regulator n=1 Tax=Planobispora longispora TaxID=28887 RepID=A0A8J3RVE3_9ACTN|nr:response regulator [Planobispora longispora]GIH78913.1 response regulator [Planobispora longispora]
MKDIAELINAIAALAWPLIVGIVVWRLFPVIKEIARSRGFTVNIGGAELTVQEISEKLLESTAVIQGRLASAPPEEPEALPDRYLRRVLWVDDVPANNAYEVAQLEALGVEVIRALSTGEGMAALRGATVPFDAVISDMSREEDGFYNRDAGLDLAREMRGRGDDRPLFVYGSRRTLAREDEILAAGGNGVTYSPTTLLQMLRSVGRFPREENA